MKVGSNMNAAELTKRFIKAGFIPYAPYSNEPAVVKNVYPVDSTDQNAFRNGKVRYVVTLRRTQRKGLGKALGIVIDDWMLQYDNGESYEDRPVVIWFHEK